MRLRLLLAVSVFLPLIFIRATSLGDGRAVSAKLEAGKHPRLPHVDAFLQLSFRRVPGQAYGEAVLDTGEVGSWYSHSVDLPTVDFDGRLYRMWFVGGSETADPGVPYGIYQRVGLAESRDGISWTLGNGGKPVLDLGPPGAFDSKGISHPYVLRVGKKYLMWFGGIDGRQAKDLGLKPNHVRIERIGLAISNDGIHWKRANSGKPVLDIGAKDSIDSIQATGMHVLRISGRFVMWYGAYNGVHTLGIATSSDGIRWEKINQGKAVTGLLGPEQLGPSVYFDGARYFMLYNRNFGRQWATYGATSIDGIHWVPAFEGQPVLGPPPAGNFGTAGQGRNHSVHPSQILVEGRRVRVWYAAEDGSPPHHQRVGLMEATLP